MEREKKADQASDADAGDVLKEIENSPRGRAAMEYFLSGYNCTQAVALAFADLFDMDETMLLRMSSSFGGGMGRLREVCGTVSGMFLVAGLLYGYDDPKDFEGKAAHYGRIQELAGRFRERQGSIVCRELLGLSGQLDGPVPERRTQEYYQKRPCPQLAGLAAAILERFMEENPVSPNKM
ncbi:MAG: C-GCAxxG-C-C family protein [Muribaculum sp.]|nr:C-GCAxxG-C-C family protein [Muribaculum sp.]